MRVTRRSRALSMCPFTVRSGSGRAGRMREMKLSVSLPDDDVVFLNDYAEAHALSRSAVVHEAIRGLRGEFSGVDGGVLEEWDTVDDPPWGEAACGD